MTMSSSSAPTRRLRRLGVLLAASTAFTVFTAQTFAQTQPTVVHLHSFTGQSGAGASPLAPPAFNATDGRVYGIANRRGAGSNSGFVYTLNPAGTDAAGIDFKGSNSGLANTFSSVTAAGDGTFYAGSTAAGVYRFSASNLVPTAVTTTTTGSGLKGLWATDGATGLYFVTTNLDTPHLYHYTAAGVTTDLVPWTSRDSNPAVVIASSDGWLYGVNDAYALGTSKGFIYRVKPDGTGYTVMRSFDDASGYPAAAGSGVAADAAAVFSGLVDGNDGWLYGTTYGAVSGAGNGLPADGLGKVYRIGKTAGTGGAYPFEVLHTFAGGTADGERAAGALVLAGDGNIYGTTRGGGANSGAGTLFRIVVANAADSGKSFGYELLHSFDETVDGRSPVGLSVGTGAVLYGATQSGGTITGNTGVNLSGTVFRVDVPIPAKITAFSASADSVTVGSNVSLTWTTQGALACTAGGSNGGVWAGARAASGSAVPTAALSVVGANTFTLVCTDATGTPSATSTLSVTVNAAPTTPTTPTEPTTPTTPTTPSTPAPSSGGGGGPLSALLLAPLAVLWLLRRRQRPTERIATR